MIGPGKYGDLTERFLAETDADALVLIVLGGNKGDGMSMSVKAEPGPDMQFEVVAKSMVYVQNLPRILRKLAAAIERDSPTKG